MSKILSASALALICALPQSVFAERFEAPAKIDHVTLYPDSADVLRQVTFAAPAGEHSVLITGVGAISDAQSLRVIAPDGVVVGAVRLSTSRLPVTGDVEPAEVTAAKAAITAIEDTLRQRDAEIAGIALRVEAANAQLAAIKAIGAEGARGTADAAALAALITTVGTATLEAGQAALTAQQDVDTALRARQQDADALADAQQALAALQSQTDAIVVEVTFSVESEGEVTLGLMSQSYGSSWTPVYDVDLKTGEQPTLTLDRGIYVLQQTGEDWVDVALTLSTARPGGQLTPQASYAARWSIVDEKLLQTMARDASSAPGIALAPEPTVVALAEGGSLDTLPRNIGATLVYDYGSRVTLRTGADALRLSLGSVEYDARIWAEANPTADSTAYRMAEFTNLSDQIWLPGRATLSMDGAVVGFSDIGLTAARAEVTLGFGPIDGLQVEAQYPSARQGDIGFVSRANQSQAQTVLIARNLTGESWPLLVREGLVYSEQDDLDISYDFSVAPDRIDPDGARGIVEWDLTLAPGAETKITIDQTAQWPTGFILQQ